MVASKLASGVASVCAVSLLSVLHPRDVFRLKKAYRLWIPVCLTDVKHGMGFIAAFRRAARPLWRGPRGAARRRQKLTSIKSLGSRAADNAHCIPANGGSHADEPQADYQSVVSPSRQGSALFRDRRG
jgi:hypothetical protein